MTEFEKVALQACYSISVFSLTSIPPPVPTALRNSLPCAHLLLMLPGASIKKARTHVILVCLDEVIFFQRVKSEAYSGTC